MVFGLALVAPDRPRRPVEPPQPCFVADGIDAFTLDALQRASIWLELNFRLASRTCEYFQEFLTDCHELTFRAGMHKAYHKGQI